MLASLGPPIIEHCRREQPCYEIIFNGTGAFTGEEGDSKGALQSNTSVCFVFPNSTPTLSRAQQSSSYKQVIRPAPIPGNDNSDRKRLDLQTGSRRVICHKCKKGWHCTPPHCTLKFRDYPTIVFNYQKLNADDKVSVPCTSYNEAVRLFEAENESKVATQVKESKIIVRVLVGTPLSDITNKSVRRLTQTAERLSANLHFNSPFPLWARPKIISISHKNSSNLEFFTSHGEEPINLTNRKPFSLWFFATAKVLQTLVFLVALLKTLQQLSTLHEPLWKNIQTALSSVKIRDANNRSLNKDGTIDLVVNIGGSLNTIRFNLVERLAT